MDSPEEGWFKINSDGTYDNDSCSIAAGELIRNHLGIWIKGFHQFLGVGNSFLAELWGAFLGLKLASSLGASKIWLESDCINLVIESLE